MWRSSVNIPMNNSEIKYRGLIKKKKNNTKNEHLDRSRICQNAGKAAAKHEDV